LAAGCDHGLMPSLIYLNHNVAGVALVKSAIPLARHSMGGTVVWLPQLASPGFLAVLLGLLY